LTEQEKVDLLNTLHSKVVYHDYDTDDETCYGVIVPLPDDKTREVLRKLGLTGADIMKKARWDSKNKRIVINLIELGFPFAERWNPETGFSLK
jgi:hypothetical protein